MPKAKSAAAPDRAALDEIVALAEQQLLLEKKVARAEDELSLLKAQLRAVQEESLPLAMITARMEQFTLDNGFKIEVKEDYTVGIPAARRPEAFAWLEKGGYGGLIKTEVITEFGKGELAKAQKLVTALAAKQLNVALRRDIHWQTLKAFINESVRENRAVPMDLFGASPLSKAKITPPKTERKK